MTNKQLLASVKRLERHLHKTTEGYVGHENGVHWRNATGELDKLKAALDPKPQPKVPVLGPVVRGGRPILEQDLTHETGGVPHHPAFDDAIGHPGVAVIAPEPMTIEYIGRAVRRDGRPDGQSVHAMGASGVHYWFGHLERALPAGTKLRRAQQFGVISANHEAPHVHVGVDARKLIGRDLAHHSDYTHGAEKVGSQLRKALA